MKQKSISASEIGRFIYCNYAWYYEKKYGTSALRKMNREYLEEIGVDPTAETPLTRGLNYHANFGRYARLKLAAKIIAAIVIAAAFAYLWMVLI